MTKPELSYLARADKNLNHNYKRFPVTFVRGSGIKLFDDQDKEYLDFGGGIAVNSLGHAHPEIAETIYKQSSTLTHISNLYYNIPQIELAEKLNSYLGNKGKMFFCNSGTEANECLIKLARKFGNKTGRFEIITAKNSFHGRTFGGMSATGQDKIKKGFEPLLDGFTHATFNDFSEIEKATTDKTCAVIIEGIQGEGGVITATSEYLKSIREFCTKKNILFLVDSVQCGFFRTGKFQSFQRILEEDKACADFLPDGIAMAKSLGGGFPIGATWISDSFQEVLDAGSHGSTYGGNPLACAVALKIIEIVERDNLIQNVKSNGDFLTKELNKIKTSHPDLIKDVRGLGFMQGVELSDLNIPEKYSGLTSAALFVVKAIEHGLLLVPAATNVLRILPPLNTSKTEIELGLKKFKEILLELS